MLLSYLWACDVKKPDAAKMQSYTGPTIKAFNLEMVLSDSAKKKVLMLTPLQLEFQSGNQEYPKGVTVEFFNEKGEKYTRLTANKGNFDKNTNRYKATGNVIVKNITKNEQLNTEELNWSPGEQRIFTDKFVTITTLTEILKGNGLTAKQDFSSYQITQPTGKFTVKKAP
jgi:LPS export ABC transporter protein LptC